MCYLFKVNSEAVHSPGGIPLAMVWYYWYFDFSSLMPDFLWMERILSKYSPLFRIFIMLAVIYPV